MRKRWFLIGMIFLLLLLLTAGCGVAQEQYDAVVADLGTAQQELQSVKGKLETAQAKNSELTSSLGKTKTELEAAQAKVSELTSSLGKSQSELETAQAKVSELTSSLEKGKTELEATEAEFTAFKSDIKSKWASFDKVSGLEWLLVGYWSAAAKGNEELVEQLTAKMVSFVEPIGDSMLNSLWTQAMSAAEKGQENLFLESFAALMDRNSMLFKTRAKAIRDKLAE